MTGFTLCYIAIFVLESTIAWMYFEALFENRRNRYVTAVLYIIGYLTLFLVSRFENSLANTAAFFLVNIIIVVCLYNCKAAFAILHCAFLTFVMCITEVLVALALEHYTGSYDAFRHSFTAMIAAASISKIFYLLISAVASKLFGPDKTKGNSAVYTFLLCILPVISIVITLTLVHVGLNCELIGIMDMLMSASALLLLVLNIVVLLVYRYIQKVNQTNAELKIANIREQASAEYYEMLKTQYESQRILIHDIKGHLSAIKDLADESNSERIATYVEKLQDSQALSSRIQFCPEPVLNAILMRYNEKCHEMSVKFMCDIRTGVSFLDDVSMTALFENLLSNAVDAAVRVLGGYVELSICIPAGPKESIVINVVNSCKESPPRNENGELETKKHDRISHGFGMKSIVRIVDKYSGSMKTYFDNATCEFHVVICFPKT